jgi:hypothetical protein
MINLRSSLRHLQKRTYLSTIPGTTYDKRWQFQFRHAYTYPNNEPNQTKENQTVWDSKVEDHANNTFNLFCTTWNNHHLPGNQSNPQYSIDSSLE